MSNSAAWFVYAEQLVGRGYGLPLWHPEPIRYGKEPREVEIGDVGYVSEGRFIRLFNAMRPKGDTLNACGMPKGFEVLKANEENLFSDPMHVDPGPICTTTTTFRKLGAGISDSAQLAGASYTFNCHSSRGAIAILGSFGHQEWYESNSEFWDYTAKYHSSWYDFAKGKGLLIPPEAIVLVSGWLKTTEWAVAAVSNYGKAHDFSFTASAGSYASANFDISGGKEVQMSIEKRSGPAFRDEDQPATADPPQDHLTELDPPEATPDPPDATLDPPKNSPAQRPEQPCNQSTFLRYYKFKTGPLGLRREVDVIPDANDMIGPGDEHHRRRQPPGSGGGGSSQGSFSRFRSFFGGPRSGTSPSDSSGPRSDEPPRGTSVGSEMAPQTSQRTAGRDRSADNKYFNVGEEPPSASRVLIPDPLDDLLDLMLECCPGATAAVACHEEFYSIFPPEKYPEGVRRADLQEKLSQGLDVQLNKDGVAFISKGGNPDLAPQEVNTYEDIAIRTRATSDISAHAVPETVSVAADAEHTPDNDSDRK
ncbi:uncharacterized protein PHACADRAFT_117831 [Phanerochaete carnosa HHB-10118-sp]|uniref:Uncharacterized protein n=1 Tax=Phanerochaete carnosa (strain HHB-10118-sp) TaxID=650164 RepID=K5X774_PHACS|nr:uncharacterized protein PHACADRAFT_117831 [Phanerochaete carnosa HHB-10118-sp]EKM58722.1 hypothetical protein PHACADRAFT_117831 [Phanerochaete carnosa HHB-10118-sp]